MQFSDCMFVSVNIVGSVFMCNVWCQFAIMTESVWKLEQDLLFVFFIVYYHLHDVFVIVFVFVSMFVEIIRGMIYCYFDVCACVTA